ncbi:DNA-binding transcriptional regulator, LysR family [Lentibacillus halodurans]|uniref:DNA-binding transcriptional regulator, LysR family n=1 Tax=Lentibacillus halodurans TaxID=237679 RepID=A0A1I0ZU38_9BACI|nr:LysR family transcriptional regulator [Lentibacillus halodurans]SFB29234.1 DNA-binding transcriptional regulator, LysR family [Lentibacillus halodurans]
MEHRHLITFITIVKKGGFKIAADELGYAQSSVTGHIKELEEELGKPLFDRLGRKITLTQAGKDFLPFAEDIIQLYSKAKEVLNSSDDMPSGQLTIGASESIMIYWLPDIISEFMGKYPKVELVIKSLDYDNLSNQLKNGDIDVALLIELSNWKGKNLIENKLKNENLSLVKSVKKENQKKIEGTMLITEYSCSWRPAVEAYINKQGKDSILKVELPSVEAIKKYVLCGLGKSMLPHFIIKDELERNQLEEMEANVGYNSLGIYTAIHKDKWISRNLEVFLSILENKSEK